MGQSSNRKYTEKLTLESKGKIDVEYIERITMNTGCKILT